MLIVALCLQNALQETDCQVPGRKKTGNLARPIGVRLDAAVDAMVRTIAERSKMVENEPGTVIRILATAYFMRAADPIAEFDEVAQSVMAWRKAYNAGLAAGDGDDGGGRGGGPEGKTRRRTGRAK